MISLGDRDFNKQSVPVPGSEEKGHSAIFRNSLTPNKLTEAYFPNVETLYDNFNLGMSRDKNRPLLGHRPWDPVKKVDEISVRLLLSTPGVRRLLLADLRRGGRPPHQLWSWPPQDPR